MIRNIDSLLKIILLTACSVLCLGQSAGNYVSSNMDFVLTLPEGWKEITKSQYAERTNILREKTGVTSPDFYGGFYLSGASPFQFPYILIQRPFKGTQSYDSFKQNFSDNLKYSINKTSTDLSPVLRGVNIISANNSDERKIIYLEVEGTVNEQGSMKSLIVYCFGKRGIVTLNFYSSKEDYTENLTVFKSIIDSFKFLPGYEYSEPTFFETFNPDWEKVIGKTLGSMLGFGAMMWLIDRMRKSKT